MSIVIHEIWPRIEPYLFVIVADASEDPRIRIEFRDLGEKLSREMQFVTMACVTCARPVYPLRRREGDVYDRLYYAPCCPVGTRAACSRSEPARIEYDRFKALERPPRPPAQLTLF